MNSFATQIEIHASASAIWSILVDLPRWPEWNSTIERTQGSVASDARIAVYVKQTPSRAFPLRVTALEEPRRMVWTGGMPLGLFTGTREFTLAEHGRTTTVFSMRESYSGPLANLIGRSIPDLQPAFDEFARCLRIAAERGTMHPQPR